MMKFIENFRNDEDGAVTVDWVVLTAAVVGLAVAAYTTIAGGADDLTGATAGYLAGQDLSDYQSLSGVNGAGGEPPAAE